MTATALIAAIGDVTQFKNGRQLAAWLGLVPWEHSTGGKPGDHYKVGADRTCLGLAYSRDPCYTRQA